MSPSLTNVTKSLKSQEMGVRSSSLVEVVMRKKITLVEGTGSE